MTTRPDTLTTPMRNEFSVANLPGSDRMNLPFVAGARSTRKNFRDLTQVKDFRAAVVTMEVYGESGLIERPGSRTQTTERR